MTAARAAGVQVQNALGADGAGGAEFDLPAASEFEAWAAAALAAVARRGGEFGKSGGGDGGGEFGKSGGDEFGGRRIGGELTFRIVGRAEMADLNRRYRGQDGATDVLAFAFGGGADDDVAPVAILGDVVMCAPVAMEFAARQGIPPANHWAHLAVHGVLHLCGFDHETDADAQVMEAMERDILAEFNIAIAGQSAPVE